jgi:hypothetical protein
VRTPHRRAIVAGAFGLLLTAVVVGSQVVSVSQNPAPVAAPPAVTNLHATPHTPRPKPVPDLTKCPLEPGTVHYYADEPVKDKAHPLGKEGPHSYGPPLVPEPSLKYSDQSQADSAVRAFWLKLCTDPAFAAASAVPYDPDHSDANSHLSGLSWQGTLDFIRHSGEWSYAKGARLVYETAPENSWTGFMIPGHGKAPKVGYTRYPHGASWLLMIPRSADHTHYDLYRLKCGGQWVGPYRLTPFKFRQARH